MSIYLFTLIVSVSQLLDHSVCVSAGIVQLMCRSGRVLLILSIRALDCISGLVLLCFLVRSFY